ncbi:MAG: hypothetical protein NVS4B11_12040 [Ktedonobacteraceae bacterium]
MLAFLCAACSFSAQIGEPVVKPPTAVSGGSSIVTDILKNFKENGFDANSSINNGMGGLWINWRYNTKPLQANLTLSGVPSKMKPPQHDYNTDLRYLHALLLYKSQHHDEGQFDDEIQKYTVLVKYEFQPSHIRNDWRGWHYDEFMDLYRLSQDDEYKQMARSFAEAFANNLYHPSIGTVYATSSSFPIVNARFPTGIYRVDDAMQIGCALIQAGTQFNNPEWTQDGKNILHFVYAHAYVSSYHTFLYQMSDVLLPDGTVNPNETISRIGVSGVDVLRGRFTAHLLDGGVVAVGNDIAQSLLSLLHAYSVTHEQEYLNDAIDLTSPFTTANNALGLWDTQQLGYYVATIFPGPDAQHPGIPQVVKEVKECGRQIQMLEVFRILNTLTNNRYQSMQDSMLTVATQKAYYELGHGYLFEENAAWTPLKLPNGQPGDWVTTEAMGLSLEGLLSLSDRSPW